MTGTFNGLVLGLILTVMISPVFFSLINLSISKGIEAGTMMIAGILAGNLILFIFLLVGYDFTNHILQLKQILIFVSGIFLIISGISLIIKKEKIFFINQLINMGATKPLTIFTKGILLNILNPFVLFFWLGIMCINFSNLKNSKNDFALMFLGALIIILFFDFLKVIFANKIRDFINPKFLLWLNRITGIALAIFGINLLVKIF